MSDDQIEKMREAKRLVALAYTHISVSDPAVVNLVLAVNILIGLMEGHRHKVQIPTIYDGLTGSMQAMEG